MKAFRQLRAMGGSEYKDVTCLSCCTISQYIFSFSYCNFLIIDKQEATNEIFSHVKLAYDVAMRRNIPVNILFTSLTTHNTDPKILSGWILFLHW